MLPSFQKKMESQMNRIEHFSKNGRKNCDHTSKSGPKAITFYKNELNPRELTIKEQTK